jgi:uncharacterized protein (TIRG00374 family)
LALTSAAEPLDQTEETRASRTRRLPLGTLLKVTVTVVVTAVLLAQAGLGRLVQTLRSETDWRWVLMAIGLAAVAMVINVGRWQLMLRGQGAKASLASLVRIYLIGMFFNNVLPGRFGGDIVRAYGTSISTTTKTRSAAAVLMDRLVGAISVLVLGMLAISLNASRLPAAFQTFLIGLFLASMLILAFMLYRNDELAGLRLKVLKALDVNLLGFRIGPKIESALNALRSYSRNRGVIVRGFLISLVANGFSTVNLLFYARAVNADVNLGDVATITPFILMIGLVPISFNGIGTIEAAFVLLFGTLGLDDHVSLAIAILRRVSLLVLSLVGGLLYATRRFG